MSKIEIYTDGACSGNPGKGGWGAVLLYKKHEKKISGGEDQTTNNRMEMRAVIEALKLIKNNDNPITIYTDSQYVKNGITQWIFSWKKNGWRGADKKPVKNIDLWQEMDVEVSRHKIEWIWVRGHNGNHYNEIADELARKGIKLPPTSQ